MKAKIITQYHEESGKTFPVAEILHNRIVVLLIEGRKVDFGISEVSIAPDASFGKFIMQFAGFEECALRAGTIERLARKAAKTLGMRIKDCRRAANIYVWG